MSAIPDIPIGLPGKRQGYSAFLLIFTVLFLAGAGSLAYTLATAPDSVPWGFFTASFVFVLGVSQFGTAFVAIMRICRTNWARPFYRLAEIATLAFFPFAIVIFLLIFTYGKEHLFFWLSADPGEHLSPWLNAEFLLYRNLIAQFAFYGLAFVYFLKTLLPDVTNESASNAKGLRAALYRWLWKRRQGRDEQKMKAGLTAYSVVILVVAVIANTFIAWDFGMMLFPHYHSTVFPMYFILGNMIAGTSTVLILGAVMSRTLDLSVFFKTEQLKSMGITITGFALLWLYMFWAQFFVTWFGNLPYETKPLWTQMFGHYSGYFWVMMFCIFGIPIGTMIFAAVKRHWWSLIPVCALIIFGVWLNRYLMVVPATIADHTPFSSASEMLLVGGLFAGFLLVFLLLLKLFPMVSAWEMRDSVGEEGPAY